MEKILQTIESELKGVDFTFNGSFNEQISVGKKIQTLIKDAQLQFDSLKNSLQNDLPKLQEQKDSILKDIETAGKKQDEETVKYLAEKKVRDHEVLDSKTEVIKNTDQIVHLKKEIGGLSGEKDELDQQVSNGRIEFSKLNTLLTNTKKEVDVLTKNKTDLENSIGLLSQKESDLNKAISVKTNDIAILEDRKNKLKS